MCLAGDRPRLGDHQVGELVERKKDTKKDKAVKSASTCGDGLWKKFDIPGVVSETLWYSEAPFRPTTK